MEPPTKRQKLSQEQALAIPSRTIDLSNFQRSLSRRRTGPGKVIRPRAPDVTVTAAVVEVAVNDGSTATQIAVPTADVALTLGDLGTLTVPAVPSGSDSSTNAPADPTDGTSDNTPGTTSPPAGSTDPSSGIIVTSTNLNSTTFTTGTDNTVTVTSTSTFHVSYTNGTFIPATTTKKSSTTRSTSDDDEDGDSRSDSRSSSKFDFNQLTADSPSATSTESAYDGNNAVIGVTGTDSGAQPTSTSGSDSGASPPVLSPQQTRMVGGIVGGIAGIAMVLIVLLYVLRWYRARLKKQGRLPHQLTSSHTSRDFGVSGLAGCAAPMSQNRASFFIGAAGVGSKKLRPGSDMTTLTNFTSTTASESEKGFHRVSGRKIPSVLSTGGDQFGGSYGAFEKESGVLVKTTPLIPTYGSDADSAHGFTPPHRPASRSAPTTPVYPVIFASEANASRRPSLSSPRVFGLDDLQSAFGRNMNKPDGVAVFHGSPARTPVMQSPNTSSLRIPSQAPVSMDSDIPDMPLPSPGLGSGMYSGIGIAIGTGAGERRIPSGRLSARSGASSGRFREDLD